MNILEKAVDKIDRNREYNLSEIADEGLFPWTSDLRSVRYLVKKDLTNENILKAEINGEGKGMNYKIKGSNLIIFLAKYGDGLVLKTRYEKKEKTHKEKVIIKAKEFDPKEAKKWVGSKSTG